MNPQFETQPTSDIIEVGKGLSEQFEDIKRSRINPEDFRGVKFFTDDEIDTDLAFVERKEKAFEEEAVDSPPEQKIQYENAQVIEAMFPMVIRDFDWLGQNTNIVWTSRYDDIAFGIDSVAQIMEPNESWNVGMEIDFTSSENEMMGKVKEIESRMQNGRMCSVKYFDSPSTGKRKNMKMPKIAFGAPRSEVENFISVVADAYLSKNKESAQNELRNHKLKKRFLELTGNQLKAFGGVAMDVGNMEYARFHAHVFERLKKRGLVK